MQITADEGIILQAKPFQETDVLITLLSKAGGKLRLLARGARGEKAKRKGTLQPFSHLQFSRTKPRNDQGLPKLTKTEFISAVSVSDPVIYAQLSLLAEISNRFLELGQEAEEIFELWHQFLQIDFQKPGTETCGFLTKFFTILGVFPDFHKCAKSGETFSAEKTIVWQDGAGIITFTEEHLEELSPEYKKLSFEELKSLYFFQRVPPEAFSRLRLTSEQERNLLTVIFQELQSHSERPFAAKAIFESFL